MCNEWRSRTRHLHTTHPAHNNAHKQAHTLADHTEGAKRAPAASCTIGAANPLYDTRIHVRSQRCRFEINCPACLVVGATDPTVRMYTTFAGKWPLEGRNSGSHRHDFTWFRIMDLQQTNAYVSGSGRSTALVSSRGVVDRVHLRTSRWHASACLTM